MAVIRDGKVKHNRRTYVLGNYQPEWEGLTVRVSQGTRIDGSEVSIADGYQWLTNAYASVKNPPGFDEMSTGEKGWWLASLVTELKHLSMGSQIELLNGLRRNAGEFHPQAHDVAKILTSAYNIPWRYGYDD